MRRNITVATILWSLVSMGCSSPPIGAPELSDGDRERIQATVNEFAGAWLANDPTRVLATLSEDAVLIPHHGHPVVAGRKAIEEFWWPEGQPARVTRFSATQDEVSGMSSLAYARGRFVLAFEYEGIEYSNEGNYVVLLKKDPQGVWKISHRIWNDPLPETE